MQTHQVKIADGLGRLSESQIGEMVSIVTRYFPDQALSEEITRNHISSAASIRIALAQEKILGFSVASAHRMITPFHRRPVNVIYQRMLFVDTGALYHGLGKRLQVATMKDLYGWYWPFRTLVAICRTQNPVVARLMNLFNLTYPQYRQPIPPEIRQFAETLLPVIDAESVDSGLCLPGILESIRGIDYTEIWNRYPHRENDYCDQLMLENVFEEKSGRIINNGTLVLMIAYARPFNFIRYLFHR